MCIVPINDRQLMFEMMTLVVIPRNQSNNFSISLPSGKYRVIASDLENNTNNIPREPQSLIADSEDVNVTSDSSECIKIRFYLLPSFIDKLLCLLGTTSPPTSSEDIAVTVPSKSDVQVTCPLPLNCLVLIQSLTFLNKLYVGFIDSSSTSTNVSVDTVIDNSYVVVYSWDSEQSIFDGIVSLISQLHSPTSKYISVILIHYKHLIYIQLFQPVCLLLTLLLVQCPKLFLCPQKQ